MGIEIITYKNIFVACRTNWQFTCECADSTGTILMQEKIICYVYTAKVMEIYFNIYPTKCNVTQFILSGNCSTCFGWYYHPSSGAQTTVSTASGICRYCSLPL
jgi:hypothetical protein